MKETFFKVIYNKNYVCSSIVIENYMENVCVYMTWSSLQKKYFQ